MIGSTGVVDGNGMFSPSGFRYRGVGLFEPGMLPVIYDNLDGLMFEGPAGAAGFPPGGIWFSLDSAFPDPLTGLPNSGSAVAHGFVGGDVVHTAAPGGPPVLYAPAPVLGLDLFGPDRDDLDALILLENGFPGYQPSVVPYDWVPVFVVPKDMLLFSVRRGSMVLGMPDSIFGLPIEEGDLLTTLRRRSAAFRLPGIFVAAENLGLATSRSMGVVFGDDLDAAELPRLPLYDCNGNGREDAVDIGLGSSLDGNLNGIPDECRDDLHAALLLPAAAGTLRQQRPDRGLRQLDWRWSPDDAQRHDQRRR